MKRKLFLLLVIVSFSFNIIKAQEVIEIKPLFDYPVAPENIESLSDRCDYLVKNFWDNFDFKIKDPVDQYALNEAFQVYTSAMPYASKKEVDQSVEKLIGKISSNPVLLLQFSKAAEENFYGPRADFWSDELYLKFLDAIIKNKKISETRKTRYISQAESLRQSAEGNVAPTFDFIDSNGDTKTYFPMSTPTLLIIGNPDNTDWRMARLKMESNFRLEEALNKGKVNILYIIPTEMDNWTQEVSNYNSRWTVGTAADISKKYDTRLNPALYLIGSDGKIIVKNFGVNEGVEALLGQVN